MKSTWSFILPLACRNLLRNRRRTGLTLGALALAVVSMVLLGAFLRAWTYSSLETTIENLTGHAQIHHPQYVDDPVAEYSMNPLSADAYSILESPRVASWAPRIRAPAIIRSERENSPVSLVGIDGDRESALSFIGSAVETGSYLNGEHTNGILIGKRLADRLQTRLNHRVVLLAQGANGDIREMGFKVVGIFSADTAMENGFVFIDWKRAQAFLELGDRISEIALKVVEMNELPLVVEALRSTEPHLDTKSWDELQPFTKAMMEMNESSIGIWILVSFGVVSFGLVNSLLMAVHERIREFGLFQALGMKPRWLLAQVIIESTFLVVLGNIMGLLAGVAIIWCYRDGVSLGIGAEYFGAGRSLYPKVDLNELLFIGFSVVILGLLASLYPAFHAARRLPIEVLNRATN